MDMVHFSCLLDISVEISVREWHVRMRLRGGVTWRTRGIGSEQEEITACGIRDQGKKRGGCCVDFT